MKPTQRRLVRLLNEINQSREAYLVDVLQHRLDGVFDDAASAAARLFVDRVFARARSAAARQGTPRGRA